SYARLCVPYRSYRRPAPLSLPAALPIFDPDEDAFGRKKNGVPNRSVADELVGAGVDVRWCDTHGEQCHAKFLLHQADGQASMLLDRKSTRLNSSHAAISYAVCCLHKI